MGNCLLNMLESVAVRRGGAVALFESERKTASFRDLAATNSRHIEALENVGVGRNARIAVLMGPSPETAVFILACCCAATAFPVNPALSVAEIQEILANANITHLSTSRELLAKVGSIAKPLGIPLILLKPDNDGPAGSARITLLDSPTGSHAGTGCAVEDRDDEETALVLLTSGCTGKPKRVPLSLANLCAGARNIAGSIRLKEDDRALSMMPMFHVGGIVDLFLAPVLAGSAVAFARDVSAAAFFRGLETFEPTWFQAVPAIVAEIMRHAPVSNEKQVMQGLRFVRVVAQALSVPLQEAFESRFGVPLIPTYGMTEATGVIASVSLGENSPSGSVGKEYGTEILIADAYRNQALPGQSGEVLIAGPAVSSGYEGYQREQSFRGKWLKTGDEGVLDEGGNLVLIGRLKELINKGGEKIAPLEIDRLVAGHPAVLESAAFAVAHPTLGEEVALAAVPQQGHRPDLADIQAFLRPNLAEYKLPRSLHILDRLPRVASGKLDRKALPAVIHDRARHSRDRTPPTTPTEKKLASLWEEVLEMTGVGLEDDFFELGGDSLSATNLAILMERYFKGITATGDMFLRPTLREMAGMIGAAREALPHDSLRQDLHDALRKATIAWRGARKPGSIIVNRNETGGRTPFFWIVQSRWQFEPLCEHLSRDRPLHVLSSLSTTNLRSDANTAELARWYAGEILQMTGGGPIHLGGFCQGGLVAFHVAKLLEQSGRRPDILCLQDRFIPEPYGGPVAFFSGKRGRFCLYDRFTDPAAGWAKYYSGAVSFHMIDADHDDLHKEPYVAAFAADLDEVLDSISNGRAMPGSVQLSPRPPIDPALHGIYAQARIPLFMRPGSVHRIPVRVFNRSPATLYPTAESGIALGAEWRGYDALDGYSTGGRAVFEKPLLPGEKADMEINVRMPMRSLPVLFGIDLLEEGVSWFYDHRRGAVRRIVLPSPGI